ncbi:hypothetical protein B0H11DRAFT_1996452 [Mycena galericulata]|nr:hypothetical protein B0H11DRAFT_1996452 [Mycena galericulata]
MSNALEYKKAPVANSVPLTPSNFSGSCHQHLRRPKIAQPRRKTVRLVVAPVAQVDSSPRRIRPHTSSTPGRHARCRPLGNYLHVLTHPCLLRLSIAQRRWRQRPAKSCVGCVGERIRILAEQLALDRRCARVIFGSLRMRRACLWPGRYIQRRTSVENRRTPWSTYRRCKTWYSVPARSPAPTTVAVPALLTVAPLDMRARHASLGGGPHALGANSTLPRFPLPALADRPPLRPKLLPEPDLRP